MQSNLDRLKNQQWDWIVRLNVNLRKSEKCQELKKQQSKLNLKGIQEDQNYKFMGSYKTILDNETANIQQYLAYQLNGMQQNQIKRIEVHCNIYQQYNDYVLSFVKSKRLQYNPKKKRQQINYQLLVAVLLNLSKLKIQKQTIGMKPRILQFFCEKKVFRWKFEIEHTFLQIDKQVFYLEQGQNK